MCTEFHDRTQGTCPPVAFWMWRSVTQLLWSQDCRTKRGEDVALLSKRIWENGKQIPKAGVDSGAVRLGRPVMANSSDMPVK